MRLAVFGATGGTGKHVVRMALEEGHDVRALVRSAERAERALGAHDRLELREGDLLDAGAVASAVEGADAVVDVSGPTKQSPADLRRRSVTHILDAMGTHGVERLVVLTGGGMRVPEDQPRLADKLIRGLMSVVARDQLDDAQAMGAAIRASDRRWTIVRAPRLSDDPERGQVRSSPQVGVGTGIKLGREDLARFVLEVAKNDTWVGQAPMVSW